MKPIYLDYNATTPIDPRVADAMMPYVREHFGNPSSGHAYGAAARKAVERARGQVAALLGCEIHEVVFTSGGSESNNLAIKGAVRAYRSRGNHIITSAVEHPAVTEVLKFLEAEGCKVTYLPVDGYGLVDPASVEEAITPATVLITIMHANNEVGTVEPVADIAEIARSRDILMHSDCAQSLGKIPVTVPGLGVDLISVAGHKVYAPKGVGALYIRAGVELVKQIHGADHEMDRRAGTENVIEIVGLGEACAIVAESLGEHAGHMHKLRDRLESGLLERFPKARVNGHPEKRLPNTLNVSFMGLEANTILSELSGVAASAGAACHTDRVEVSSVLEAMNVPIEYAMGTLRFSVGRFTTAEEVDSALEEIAGVVGRMQPSGARPAAEPGVGPVRLTRYTHGLGCACKMRPQLLEKVLESMPVPADENVLVGADTADDAAVYRIGESTAIVQTVDFFTPVVDDPYQFGAIAAANSLSDIYAMGGRPLFALSVVGFPSGRLPVSVLEDILKGAYEKAREGGMYIIGGHTVEDTEPKFGLAVTGVIDPAAVLTNRGAKPGDTLVLTKPIGTGILSTALKQDLLDPDQQHLLVGTMAALNRAAAEALVEIGANACTDITGFGLMGHLLEMMRGSGTRAAVAAHRVPLLEGAVGLAASGVVPGGTLNNRDYTDPHVRFGSDVPETARLLLNDAQTSGGLLVSLPAERADSLVGLLENRGVPGAAAIGTVEEAGETGGPRIVVRN